MDPTEENASDRASQPAFSSGSPPAEPLPAGWLSRWPWLTFVLPMAIYMLVGSVEPTPPAPVVLPTIRGEESSSDVDTPPDENTRLAEEAEEFFRDDSGGLLPEIPYRYYPVVYTVKIVFTLAAMALVWPGYRTFRGQVSPMAFVVGAVGVVLWVVLCHLQLEVKILAPIDRWLGSWIPGWDPDQTPTVGLMGLIGAGARSAYNPLEHLAATPMWAWAFLTVRFLGLAAVVPVIEEFFLRGFLMRFVMHEQWWQVRFGLVNRAAVVVGTAIPMLMHPGELFAAFVWFSMVTWLMVRTRNIWDCVVAHAVTNFLLGVYVVTFDQWQLM